MSKKEENNIFKPESEPENSVDSDEIFFEFNEFVLDEKGRKITIKGTEENVYFFRRCNNGKKNLMLKPSVYFRYLHYINFVNNKKYITIDHFVDNMMSEDENEEIMFYLEKINNSIQEKKSKPELEFEQIINEIKKFNFIFYIKSNVDLNYNNEITNEFLKSHKKYFLTKYNDNDFNKCINYKKKNSILLNKYHYELLNLTTLEVDEKDIVFTKEKNLTNIIINRLKSDEKTIIDLKFKLLQEFRETLKIEKNHCDLWNKTNFEYEIHTPYGISTNYNENFNVKYDEFIDKINEKQIKEKFIPQKYEFVNFFSNNCADSENNSRLEIIKNINKFTFGLMKNNIIPWDKKNIIMSGGLLYNVLTNYDNNFNEIMDIDLFLVGENIDSKIDTCKEILDNLIANQYEISITYNNNIIAIFIKDIPRKIQLILVNETPEEIISTFDFTHLMFYYDGMNIYGTEKSIKQLVTNNKTTLLFYCMIMHNYA